MHQLLTSNTEPLYLPFTNKQIYLCCFIPVGVFVSSYAWRAKIIMLCFGTSYFFLVWQTLKRTVHLSFYHWLGSILLGFFCLLYLSRVSQTYSTMVYVGSSWKLVVCILFCPIQVKLSNPYLSLFTYIHDTKVKVSELADDMNSFTYLIHCSNITTSQSEMVFRMDLGWFL